MMQSQHYDELAELENTYWWFQVRFQLASRLLFVDPQLYGAGLILDYGCGTGGFLDYLNRVHGISRTRTLGLEPWGEACKMLERKKIPYSRLSSTGAPPIGELTEPPAAVVMLDVIEHLEDPVFTLRSLREAAAPGARLVVTAPAFPNLWSQWDEALGHRRRYRKSELHRELQAAGWILQESRYFFGGLYFATLLRKRLIAMGLISALRFPRVPPRLNWLLTKGLVIESRLRFLPVGASLAAAAHAPISREYNPGLFGG